MNTLRKVFLLLVLASLAFADNPSPTYNGKKDSTEVIADKTQPKAEERQDSYGAPAADTYGAPQAPAAQDSYGSPKAPAQDSYGAPSAPVEAKQTYSAPSQVGTQGYYYYYYPVSTAPVESKPSYAPPRQGFAGGNNPLASFGAPIIIAIIAGIGIIVGIGILIAAAASSTTTTTTGRSFVNFLNDHVNDITDLAYDAIDMYNRMNA